MFLPPVKVVPFLLPLLSLVARAQPAGEGSLPQRPPTLVTAPEPTVEVHLAPGRPATLLFGAALDTDAVRRASRELGLERVALAEDMMTLLLPAGLEEGTRLRLPVRFADGQPPEVLSLVLVVDAANARSYVQVPRRPEAAQAMPPAESVAATAPGGEGGGALRGAGGLTDLVAAGVISKTKGVKAFEVPATRWESTGAVRITVSYLYVGSGRMAVVAELQGAPMTAAGPPWTPGAVKLTLNGTPVPVWSMRWLGGPLAKPHDSARLVVEWEATAADSEMTLPLYALEVTGQGGGGTLRTACLSNQECAPGRKP